MSNKKFKLLPKDPNSGRKLMQDAFVNLAAALRELEKRQAKVVKDLDLLVQRVELLEKMS